MTDGDVGKIPPGHQPLEGGVGEPQRAKTKGHSVLKKGCCLDISRLQFQIPLGLWEG